MIHYDPDRQQSTIDGWMRHAEKTWKLGETVMTILGSSLVAGHVPTHPSLEADPNPDPYPNPIPSPGKGRYVARNQSRSQFDTVDDDDSNDNDDDDSFCGWQS